MHDVLSTESLGRDPPPPPLGSWWHDARAGKPKFLPFARKGLVTLGIRNAWALHRYIQRSYQHAQLPDRTALAV